VANLAHFEQRHRGIECAELTIRYRSVAGSERRPDAVVGVVVAGETVLEPPRRRR